MRHVKIQTVEDLKNLQPYTDFVAECDLEPHEIPVEVAKQRVRWTTHPEDSVAGVCDECKSYSGKFMSMEQAAGLQPVHPNCVCGWSLAPGGGGGIVDIDL